MTDFKKLNQIKTENIIKALSEESVSGHKIIFENIELAKPNVEEILKLLGSDYNGELWYTNVETGEACYRFTKK